MAIFNLVMKNKHKLLIANFATLLVGGILLTHFSYAWINNNRFVDKLEFKTGGMDGEVNGYLFKRTHVGLDVDTTSLPHLSARQITSSTGEIVFSFSQDSQNVLEDFDIGDFYLDEHTLNTNALPSILVELQIFSRAPLSYVKIGVETLPYSGGESRDFADFSYRYMLVDNDILSPIDYATPNADGGAVGQLNNLALTPLAGQFNLGENGSEQLTFDLTGASNQELSFYQDKFVRSLVFEIMPTPLSFYHYLTDTFKNSGRQSFSLGTNVNFFFEYQLESFEV